MKVGTDGVLLGAWATVEGATRVLDIGAGTGVIAIMMAQRAQEALIHAVEIDAVSCGQAKENMERSPWSDRLFVFHDPVQTFAVNYPNTYDLILSNPPFFSGGTFSYDQHRSNVRHTIKLPHGDLLSSARRLLAPHGRFAVILPYIEGLRFQELAESYHLYCTRITEVRPKANKPVERLLMEFQCHPRTTTRDTLIIQYEGVNEWTEEYKALTGAFYLYM